MKIQLMMARKANCMLLVFLVLVDLSCHIQAHVDDLCAEEPNLALNRPTAQSSTAHKGISYRAVDGITDGAWSRSSCTHTNHDNKAWWRVDLGSCKQVKRVVIYNREDCCSNRLHNFYIRVGNSLANHGNNNPICAASQSLNGYKDKEIRCSTPLNGRYLNIQLHGTNYLTLCEVKVFSN